MLLCRAHGTLYCYFFKFTHLFVCASSVSDVTGYGNFGVLRKTKDISQRERRRPIFKTWKPFSPWIPGNYNRGTAILVVELDMKPQL
jgi:hypothetical protein